MTKETTIKRTYTIPLREKFANTPRHKRTNKAVRVLKEFLVKHMKSDDVKIGPKLNETLWKDGIKNPPGKVKVQVTKDKEGVVRAEIDGIDYVDFKPQEKKAEPANLKEKIEAKLDGDSKKKPVKKDSKEEKPVTDKVEVKSEEKVDIKTEAPKADTKAPAKEEVKKAPAAESKTE